MNDVYCNRPHVSAPRRMLWTGWLPAECALVVLYLVPQTSVLAAIVMTGYLGGAVATHLRIADTARAAIPLVVGILAWGGLYLRDSRIRQLVPFRRSA